jgi:hypothetical protein
MIDQDRWHAFYSTLCRWASELSGAEYELIFRDGMTDDEAPSIAYELS